MNLKITLFFFLQLICFYQIYSQCDGADFEERNGIAILELDSKVAGSWRKETISGASGNTALTYRGSDNFNSPGNSTITYNIKINSPGTYRFLWRNKISIIATDAKATTEHNDSWLKINASNFFGKSGSSLVYPGGSGKTPVANGATSGGWFKVYTNTINWNWTTNTSDRNPHAIYASFNSAGVYSIQVSARSKGHSIDRMVLYKEGSYSASQAQSLARSVTDCSGGTPPAPPTTNEAPIVNITSPTRFQDIEAGSTVTVRLSASDSDGSISKHEIFVNNARVDTDGSSYSPYSLTNIKPGDYAIKATVTDNNGKTASSTVNISVDSTTEPDPNPTPPSNSAPTVTFSNLKDGQVFSPGGTVSIGLSSNDQDGSVIKHQVFVNNVLVDTDGSTYTSHLIENIRVGNYTIRAVVTDNSGATASKTITISVVSNTDPNPPTNLAPSVTFTNLTNGQNFDSGEDVLVNLRAFDSDGRVIKHEIFINNNLVDTDGSNYTPHIISKISAGNYEIRAVVTDNEGKSNMAIVNIVVDSSTPPTSGNSAPTVQFVNINEGQVIPVNKVVYIGLTSNDSDGNVVKHQVFINGKLVDTDGSTYTSHPFQESTKGNYIIKVEVTDNDGLKGSASINVIVDSSLSGSSSSITLTLIDAIANLSLGSLNDGAIISSSLAQGLNVKADVPAEVKSVLFDLYGVKTFKDFENFQPYALFGNSKENYYAQDLPSGSYELKVSAFSDVNGAGVLLYSKTVNFIVSPTSSTGKSAFAFPNPVLADGRVAIHLPNGSSGDYNYSISNSMGVQIEAGDFVAKPSQMDIDLELSNLGRQVPGVYYITLSSRNLIQTIPLIRK